MGVPLPSRGLPGLGAVLIFLICQFVYSQSAYMFGDPHVTTLDGAQYIFNGWGEYTIVSIQTQELNFTLQARTSLAQTEDDTTTRTTVSTAFGAEENGVQVFVQLDLRTRDSLVIYGNNTDYSANFRTLDNFDVEEDNFTLIKDNQNLVVAFPSGITLTISISQKSLGMLVAMPLRYQNLTQGMMGNFNNITHDDFVLPNGTMLDGTLTERQIFESFGKHWAVTSSSSIMRYGPQEGPEDYSHPDFIPLYLDEQPQAVRQAAEADCGGDTNLACIFDYIATGSAAFADASRQTPDTTDAENEQNPCPEETYGRGCSQICLCSTNTTESCDSTSGTCVCRAGWEGDTCSKDVDECSLPHVCPTHSICNNIMGSFFCSCLSGFYKSQGTCQDINECEENSDGCEQTCVNEPGSFHCKCTAGYELTADNKTCKHGMEKMGSGKLSD